MENEVRDAGVRLTCLHRRWSFDPFFALRAARKISREPVDLIHAFLPAIAFNAALAKAVWGTPTPLIYSEGTSAQIRGWMAKLHRFVLRRCDAFTANSSASRDLLVKDGIEPNHITLIPNGHVPERFQSPTGRQRIRAELGIADTEKLAVCVGRLIESKRVSDLIEALALLGSKRFSLRTVIVGDGPLREELERQVQTTGLADVVKFLGARQDVPDLLAAADLFVFPSEAEGLPNAVIEAAMAGLPIVACAIPGVVEIIGRKDDSQLVTPRCPPELANAVQRVLADLDRARANAQNVQEHARQKYAIENTLAQLYDLYERVLQD